MGERIRRAVLVWGYFLRHHLFVVVPALIAVLAVGVLAVISAPNGGDAPEATDPVGGDGAVISELSAVAEQLRIDLRTPLDGYVRRAEKRENAVSGTIAKKGPSGGCWGFGVTISESWLRDGDVRGLVIGPVSRLEQEQCTQQEQDGLLGEYLEN